MMAPRENDGESVREINISNVPNQGLGYYDKNSKLVLVSDANMQLLGR